MPYRIATAEDSPMLAELNSQLIRDEGHRNPMTIAQLEERMRGWLTSGEYRAVLFEENHTPIDMDSLQIKAKQGMFSESLTTRLKPSIQGTSLQAKELKIPAGRFLIQIEIADRHGTKTAETYRLMVREQ